MTLILKTLGGALITAGLLSTAQAALAVIDFDELKPGKSRPLPLAATPGDIVTTQYARFGLEFTSNNEVRCSPSTGPDCTAAREIAPPPHVSSPNFLMNNAVGTGFSINVLNHFSLNSLSLDIAANRNPFFVRFFDASDTLMLGSGLEWTNGSNFDWRTEVLAGVSSAVRRIEFGGTATSFAIDHLRFDYTLDHLHVPEPAVLGLVALALAGVGLSRRKG